MLGIAGGVLVLVILGKLALLGAIKIAGSL